MCPWGDDRGASPRPLSRPPTSCPPLLTTRLLPTCTPPRAHPADVHLAAEQPRAARTGLDRSLTAATKPASARRIGVASQVRRGQHLKRCVHPDGAAAPGGCEVDPHRAVTIQVADPRRTPLSVVCAVRASPGASAARGVSGRQPSRIEEQNSSRSRAHHPQLRRQRRSPMRSERQAVGRYPVSGRPTAP